MITLSKFFQQRYYRRSLIAIFLLATFDCVTWLLARTFRTQYCPSPNASSINKILLINPAHIGDVVISTSVIRRIKEFNNNIIIDFLTSQSASVALINHPGVNQIYVVDHWQLNRSELSLIKKIYKYISSIHLVRTKILYSKYDAAILLNSFSPNFALLLWSVFIPLRVGYVSVGGSPLLNLVLPKPDSLSCEQSIQLSLLDAIGIHGTSNTWLNFESRNSIKLSYAYTHRKPFIIFHPGSGNPHKEWLVDRWQDLATILTGRGFVVLITGYGKREKLMADTISQSTGAINLANDLEWSDWLSLVSKSALVIGVDSAIGHISAAFGVSFVGIYSGIGVIRRWAPNGTKVKILTKEVDCSPCHTRPCRERLCINTISVNEVLNASFEFIGMDSVNSI